MRLGGTALLHLDRWVVPRERQRIEEASAALSVLRDGDPPALSWLLRELPSLLGCERTLAYRLGPDIGGWSLDYLLWDGAPWGIRAERYFGQDIAELPSRPTVFNPAQPPAAQRNRALRSKMLSPPEVVEQTAAGKTRRKLGVSELDELRVLICDGPALLTWVGCWRSEAFGRREVALLEALVPALRSRLKLERQLRTCNDNRAALSVALEALPSAAFIVRRNGSTEHANRAGEALARRGHCALQNELRNAIASPCTPSPFEVTPVVANGAEPKFLVRLTGTEPSLAARCSHFAVRWKLTPRQTAALKLVVAGDSNKTIATKLHCALRTAELHVSALLAKSGTERRSELTARFWNDD